MSNENGEVVVVDDTTAISHSNQLELIDVEYAEACQQNYLDLVEALLDEQSDYQSGKKKKSAWRKLAKAFNISDEKICDRIIRDENHQIISAYFEVKAILPNGRYSIGVGDCSIFDKVNHNDVEMPSNFELRKRFTNAEHDVIATAHTRAKSRAISDLIGAGEVSAEEVENEPKQVSRTSKRNVDETSEKESTAEPKQKRSSNGRRSRKRTTKTTNEPKDVIETSYEVVDKKEEDDDTSSSSTINMIKEAGEKNEHIKLAISRIEESDEELGLGGLIDELYNLYDLGKLTIDEYYAAVDLLN